MGRYGSSQDIKCAEIQQQLNSPVQAEPVFLFSFIHLQLQSFTNKAIILKIYSSKKWDTVDNTFDTVAMLEIMKFGKKYLTENPFLGIKMLLNCKLISYFCRSCVIVISQTIILSLLQHWENPHWTQKQEWGT